MRVLFLLLLTGMALGGELTDAELAAKIGLRPDGQVSNPTQRAFTFQVDLFTAYLKKLDSLKAGMSPALWVSRDNRTAWTLDLADNMVGTSLNLTLVPVIRLRVGLGWAYITGDDGRYLRSRGENQGAVFLKGSVRLW